MYTYTIIFNFLKNVTSMIPAAFYRYLVQDMRMNMMNRSHILVCSICIGVCMQQSHTESKSIDYRLKTYDSVLTTTIKVNVNCRIFVGTHDGLGVDLRSCIHIYHNACFDNIAMCRLIRRIHVYQHHFLCLPHMRMQHKQIMMSIQKEKKFEAFVSSIRHLDT